ncbi:MAG: methyltransferase domain-containing protein [Bacteroidales bacterium]|nr:methyltransferase domain-containing protein [Bacteroidales bacterium]
MEHSNLEYLENCPICGSKEIHLFLKSRDYFFTKEEFTVDLCNNCGFKFTNPRPFELDSTKYYQTEDYISHSNTDKSVFSRIYKKVRRINIKSKYSLVSKYSHNKGNILDIGSGTGEFLLFLKKNGWNTFGIEPDINARNYAIQNYNLEVSDISSLNNFENDYFEIITLWHVLEHIYNFKDQVKSVKLKLKSEGIVFVAVPNAGSWDARHYNEIWAGYDLPRHISHFEIPTIQKLFNEVGFEILAIKPMKFDAFYISLLSEGYQKGGSKFFALLNGLRSNFSGMKDIGNFSSIIFVLRKN